MAGETHPTRALIGGLAEELASAMGALLGVAGSVTETEARPAADWVVRGTASGVLTGQLAVGLRHADASALARRVMGFDDPPEDGVVADMLQETCNQAFAALGQTEIGKGTRFAAGAPSRGGEPGDPDVVAAFELALGGGFSPVVVAWGRLSGATVAASPEPPAAQPRAAASPAPALATSVPAPAPHYPNLDVILDIDLPLSVRFGEAEMTVDALTKLGPGSVIDLGRSPDDPVDVLVNGKMVAKGEVVVVAGSYGVRITEVVSAADRLRSMGA
jgi:flagellar motor switch protein FliN